MNESSTEAESEVVPALERIADELQIVRNVLDEIRTDFQWAVRNGRVVIHSQSTEPVTPQHPEVTLFNEGDAVEFDLGGEFAFAEIVELNDGLNRAIVQLTPSGETITVQQDDLQKVETDRLARAQRNGPEQSIETTCELPEPGELF
ncbi:hypothetical protein [Thalassoglobus neptunius]|uniref:hypothetical protein n=1 Tax=Thalassoglobus neptunius TaxID=1938619 RepID=UPI001E4FA51C|nr:hypothetical protein [Thalassoglobus neptunius]